MASLVRTLANITNRIRVRCDQEGSDFVSDADIAEMVNASYAALHDAIYDAGGTELFVLSKDDVTIAGQHTYTITPEDDDVYRLAGVDVQFDGKWRQIERWPFTRRNDLQDTSGWTGPDDTFYRIVGHDQTNGRTKIRFFPTPSGVYTWRVWYMPIALEASASNPVVALNGWDEYIVADVCAMVLEREESDSRPYSARRELALKRLRWAAANLDDSGTECGVREVVNWGGDDVPYELQALVRS